MIASFADFCAALYEAGFTLGGGRDEGVFNLANRFGPAVRWHTGDPETDPWQWRLRVLNECGDIVYAKVFFQKSGFITHEWYPYFLAARRKGESFEDAYYDGTIGNASARIHRLLEENGPMPVYDIKRAGMFSKEEKGAFERGLIELQMRLYITMCASARRVSKKGEIYGWETMVYATAEQILPEALFDRADDITREQAVEAITSHVYELNPSADAKSVAKFIGLRSF